MTMYDIEIDYTTGDSFGSERIEGESVGIVTSDLDKAKENLRRIKAHYEKYACDSDTPDERYELALLTDEGERTIFPFWTGYFETLHGAMIVTEIDTEMGFNL